MKELREQYPFINSKPFKEYSPEEFAAHIQGIVNHTSRVAYLKKKKKKEKDALFKVEKIPIFVSFRILPSGKGSITIRKRKEKYILRSELDGICKEFPSNIKEVHEAIAKRGILVREVEESNKGGDDDK